GPVRRHLQHYAAAGDEQLQHGVALDRCLAQIDLDASHDRRDFSALEILAFLADLVATHDRHHVQRRIWVGPDIRRIAAAKTRGAGMEAQPQIEAALEDHQRADADQYQRPHLAHAEIDESEMVQHQQEADAQHDRTDHVILLGARLRQLEHADEDEEGRPEAEQLGHAEQMHIVDQGQQAVDDDESTDDDANIVVAHDVCSRYFPVRSVVLSALFSGMAPSTTEVPMPIRSIGQLLVQVKPHR